MVSSNDTLSLSLSLSCARARAFTTLHTRPGCLLHRDLIPRRRKSNLSHRILGESCNKIRYDNTGFYGATKCEINTRSTAIGIQNGGKRKKSFFRVLFAFRTKRELKINENSGTRRSRERSSTINNR